MPAKVSVIAIFDIGKTNKKLFLFAENYQIVWEKSSHLPETQDEDGDPCEDLSTLSQWVLAAWAEVQALPAYNIRAVNFSAYGASFVYVDVAGKPVAQLYNYLKPFPEDLLEEFYQKYGPAADLARETASPALGHLNSGLGLWRIQQQQPELYQRIAYALHLPQFLAFLLGAPAFTDLTSVGCHTMLWDFEKNDYHRWVIESGIVEKFAPLKAGNEAWQNEQGLWIGTGLHDSSAALIPYLACFSEPFALISTGTWSISLNPFNNSPLTAEELEQDCLCYLQYLGAPVKAARFFMGYEHDRACEALCLKYGATHDAYQQVTYDATFLDAPAHDFASAYHHLVRDLMVQQQKSTALVLTGSQVKKLYVDGGFGKNPVFMSLLAAAFPDLEVYAASVAQATALGAALALVEEGVEGVVELERVERLRS
jgi:sugar (pentulose or hexulose) kinase